MADINNVVLVGRLTRNAELKFTNSGFAISNIGLAVNRRVKKDDGYVDEVDFIDITLWGKQAESLNSYLVKGKQIGVTGELRQNRYEKDGKSHSKIFVSANNIQLLGSKSDQKTEGDHGAGISEEDIPF